MKHTPGPWFAVQYANYFSIQAEDYYSDSNVLDLEKDINAEANAKLIAAAPELLEALRTMTYLTRIKYGNLDKDVWEEIQKAEAVINKVVS